MAWQTEGVRAPRRGWHTEHASEHTWREWRGARAGGESGDRTRWDPGLRASHAQPLWTLSGVTGVQGLGVSEAGVGDLGLQVLLSPPVSGAGPQEAEPLGALASVSQCSPSAAKECVSPGELHVPAGAPSRLPFLARPGSLTLWGHAAFLICEQLSAPATQTALSLLPNDPPQVSGSEAPEPRAP